MQWDIFNTQNHIAIPQCIAMPQYNIAIPQGKSSNYRYAAIQYRHTARQIFQLSLYRNTISLYHKAIIAIPQGKTSNYRNAAIHTTNIYKQSRLTPSRATDANIYHTTAVRQ